MLNEDKPVQSSKELSNDLIFKFLEEVIFTLVKSVTALNIEFILISSKIKILTFSPEALSGNLYSFA